MRTVLLIDDDATFRALLSELIAGEGWRVVEAEDGRAGLDLAREHKPELIFCDLLMPRCNGYQFCREINAEKDQFPKTRIIVTSGSGYAIDRLNALESGADDYLTKPIKTEVLQGILRAHAAEEILPTMVSARRQEICLTFWGVRGIFPVPGPDTVFYGGNTACVELRVGGEIIILDGGTGLRALGNSLANEFEPKPIQASMLISSQHWDHLQGFSFFAPLYNPANQIDIIASKQAWRGLRAAFEKERGSSLFKTQKSAGDIIFTERQGGSFEIGQVQVRSMVLNGDGSCTGYCLITGNGFCLGYLPEIDFSSSAAAEKRRVEAVPSRGAKGCQGKVEEFLKGCDVLIAGGRHSQAVAGAEALVDLAVRAQVKELYLFHHHPDQTDASIAQMLADARQRAIVQGGYLKVEAAREGATIGSGSKDC